MSNEADALENCDCNRRVDEAAAFGATDCIECGTCSYICPGGVPVTQLAVRAKLAVLEQRRNDARHEG